MKLILEYPMSKMVSRVTVSSKANSELVKRVLEYTKSATIIARTKASN